MCIRASGRAALFGGGDEVAAAAMKVAVVVVGRAVGIVTRDE